MRVSSILPFVAIFASFASGFSRQTGLTPTTVVPLRRPLFFQKNQHEPSWTRKNPNHQQQQFTTSSSSPSLSSSLIIRGGSKSPVDTGSKCPATGFAAVFSSIWGTTGVVYILTKAIKRVLPIALEPFQQGAVPLTQFQLAAYIATCAWFAYVEGYKGFQQKFSPLVVKRSFTLIPGRNGTQWWHFLLAPFYSMGLVHATKKRSIVSWSVTIGVAVIVAAVKRLPYPWRNIVDAGVVVGLSWGSLSILAYYVKSWLTGDVPSNVDAALPASAKAESS